VKCKQIFIVGKGWGKKPFGGSFEIRNKANQRKE